MRALVTLLVIVGCGLAGCSSASPGPATTSASKSILSLYAEADAARKFGFSCVPAAYVGGPELPSMTQLRERLRARRMLIRERLVRTFGSAEIEAIESRDPEEGGTVHVNLTCAQAAKYRQKYERLLTRIERRTAKSSL